MSLKAYTEACRNFTASKESKILAITGDWGIGKTYFWQSFIKNNFKLVYPENYSYVSLFGVNSISSLSLSILKNTIDLRKNQNLDPRQSKYNKTDFVESFKKIHSYLDGAISTFEGIATSILSDTLICIDDLERADKTLNPDAFFGFLSHLKENRGCKIVLIFNQNRLEKDFNGRYSELNEKLIEKTLVFHLTPHEAVNIAIPRGEPHCEFIKEKISLLHISNIRIINHILSNVRDMISILDKFDDDILKEAISCTILATYSQKCNDGTVPPLSILESEDVYSMRRPSGGDPQKDVIRSNWSGLLQNFGWFSADEFDKSIIQYIASGINIENSIDQTAEDKNVQLAKAKLELEFRAIYGKFYSSFENDLDDFLNELVSFFENKFKELELVHLNEIFDVLNRHGKESLLDRHIIRFLDSKLELGIIFYAADYHQIINFDEKLRNILENYYTDNHDKPSLKQAIQGFIEGNINPYTHRTNSEAIASASAEDFRDYILGIPVQDREKYLEFLIKRVEVFGSDVHNRIINAIKMIASLNPTNRYRFKTRYNIDP